MALHSEKANGNDIHIPPTPTSLDSGVHEESAAKTLTSKIPEPPKFDHPHEERDFLKGRLAAAFRIFGKHGFDEGVAGHITLRVCVQGSSSKM